MRILRAIPEAESGFNVIRRGQVTENLNEERREGVGVVGAGEGVQVFSTMDSSLERCGVGMGAHGTFRCSSGMGIFIRRGKIKSVTPLLYM